MRPLLEPADAFRLRLLRSRYRLEGDQPGVELDCRGLVRAVCRQHGLPPPDGWPSILRAIVAGTAASGFPEGWRRVLEPEAWQDLDVLVTFRTETGHPSCAMIEGRYVWTTSELTGPVCVPLHTFLDQGRRADEVWRYEPHDPCPGEARADR